MKCGFTRVVDLQTTRRVLTTSPPSTGDLEVRLSSTLFTLFIKIMKKMTSSLKCSVSFNGRNRSFSFRKSSVKKMATINFVDEKGPDVQPPRNDRRTLKLSKSDEQGYGFWLQTYDFAKTDSVKKKRTFVRYVEDEGPAYLAGLRAGDVILEVNGQNVEDIEHMKIVGLISETAKQLMLVVKFMDMVRRVELAIRLKNRQGKLKVKLEELEKLKEEEKKILNTIDCEYLKDEASRLSTLSTLSAYSSTFSSSLEVDLDRLSLDTSSESGLGSLSSIADDVVVRTSKFEKRSSRVLDSIKELNCVCTLPNTQGLITSKPRFNTPPSSTDNEMLNVYSDNIGTSRNRNGMSIKRTESMPVQKRNSLPLPDLGLETYDSQNDSQNIQCSGGFEVNVPGTRYDDRILSNDDMLYDKPLSRGGISYHQILGDGDMTYDKKLEDDNMLYVKRLDDGDMLHDNRVGVENNGVNPDKTSSDIGSKSYNKSLKSVGVQPSPSDS